MVYVLETLLVVKLLFLLCSGDDGVFPFCNEAGRYGCSVDRFSVARCNLATPAPSAIDPQFQVCLPCLKTQHSQLTL